MSLRPLETGDLMLILGWRNAPQVRRFMYASHEIGEAEHRAWFDRLQHEPESRWYLHLDAGGSPDGVVYFTQYRPQSRSAFWGFYAAPAAPSGTGTRLGIDALDEAFGQLHLHKLNAEVLAENQRSRHFHEKLGFQCEGTLRDNHFDGARFVDVIRYGVIASEWPGRRRALVQRQGQLSLPAYSASSL